jgi:hypothetical protein
MLYYDNKSIKEAVSENSLNHGSSVMQKILAVGLALACAAALHAATNEAVAAKGLIAKNAPDAEALGRLVEEARTLVSCRSRARGEGGGPCTPSSRPASAEQDGVLSAVSPRPGPVRRQARGTAIVPRGRGLRRGQGSRGGFPRRRPPTVRPAREGQGRP